MLRSEEVSLLLALRLSLAMTANPVQVAAHVGAVDLHRVGPRPIEVLLARLALGHLLDYTTWNLFCNAITIMLVMPLRSVYKYYMNVTTNAGRAEKNCSRNKTMKKRTAAPKCPMCGSDNTRLMSNNGKVMKNYPQCFDCRNVWAKDKGPAFCGDTRHGFGWPMGDLVPAGWECNGCGGTMSHHPSCNKSSGLKRA